MENKEIIKLMLKSSNQHPHEGVLSNKDNLIAAINLAKLCKEFADKGQMDEAMNIESKQWVDVISELEGMSLMNWKFIFNTNLSDKWWGHIDNANKAAKGCGYKLFIWNGFVHNVDGERTNIKEEDCL